MPETTTRPNGWVLAAALVLTLVGAGWHSAAAQEEDSSKATESLSVEPAPREGIWVDFF